MTAEYLRRVFGGEFEEEEQFITTGATPVQVVGSEPDAVSLTFVNLGASTVFLRIGNQPSSTAGIQVLGNGGFLSINLTDDFTLVAREWSAVSPSGASTIYALRVRRYRQVDMAKEAGPTIFPGGKVPA